MKKHKKALGLETGEDDGESESQIEEIDEHDFGKWKMMKFKNFARNVLMMPEPSATKPAANGAQDRWLHSGHTDRDEAPQYSDSQQSMFR